MVMDAVFFNAGKRPRMMMMIKPTLRVDRRSRLKQGCRDIFIICVGNSGGGSPHSRARSRAPDFFQRVIYYRERFFRLRAYVGCQASSHTRFFLCFCFVLYTFISLFCGRKSHEACLISKGILKGTTKQRPLPRPRRAAGEHGKVHARQTGAKQFTSHPISGLNLARPHARDLISLALTRGRTTLDPVCPSCWGPPGPSK